MAAIKDVSLGRMSFMTVIAGSEKESVGDQLDVQGAIVGAGDPGPRAFTPQLPIRASLTDPLASGTAARMRRQLRAYMENDVARLHGTYFKWTVDPELNGWLLLGRADIEPGKGGGITMKDWQLTIGDGYLIGNPRTHRPARTLRSWDRRLSTTPRDFLGTLYSTDFASQTALPLHFLPVGVSDALGTGRSVLSATTRQAREGALSYLASQTDGQTVSYEQDETYRSLSCALIYDRRGISDYMSTATVPGSVETDLSGWSVGPTSLSSLPGYYGEYDASTLGLSDGDLVASWTDLSGNGNHAVQATGANKPTFKTAIVNGKAIVRFAGNQILATPAITLGKFSIYIVAKRTAASTAGVLAEHSVNANSNNGSYIYGSTSSAIKVNRAGGASTKEIAADWLPTSFTTLSHVSDGTHAGHMLYENGTDPGLTNGSLTANPGTTTTSQPLFIGARSGPTLGFSGDIAKIVVFNVAHTAAEQYLVETILASAYTLSTSTTNPLTRSNAWSAAGSWSARLQATLTAAGLTVDSPSFAVQAGATITPWIDYKINTITGGNVALSVHWSDGSSSAIATLTGGSTSPSYVTTAGLVAPGGVTSYTIRATPSAAGTYDIGFDIPLGVPGAPTRAQVLAANGIIGSPQDDLGWEEIYGPNQPLTANDVPVLDNGIGRVRYVAAGVFAVDGWLTGNGYLELGRFEIWRDYPAGTVTQFTNLVNAAVVEWSEERAVIRATFSGPDQSSRADVYLTLQRGWLGPRIEAYGSWTGGQAMGVAIRLVPANTGASTLGRSSGTTTIVDGTDHGTFAAIENWLYLTQAAAGSLALHAAVLQNGVRCIGRADTTAYGSTRNGVAVTARYGDAVAGYVSAQLGWGPTASAATDAQQLGQTALYDCRQLPELVGR